jgi:hypothetical protein
MISTILAIVCSATGCTLTLDNKPQVTVKDSVFFVGDRVKVTATSVCAPLCLQEDKPKFVPDVPTASSDSPVRGLW